MALGNPLGGLGARSLGQIKNLFWDRPAVMRAAGRAQANAQRRYGGYLRRVAQTSMRYRKGVGPPGQPPSAHKSKRLAALKKMKRAKHNGALLREFLFSVRDPSGSTVVGSMGFKGKGQPVPSLMEHGGTRQAYSGETMAVKNPAGRDDRGRFYSRGVQLVKIGGKTLRYPARPYMRPALRKTAAKFPQAFRNGFTR